MIRRIRGQCTGVESVKVDFDRLELSVRERLQEAVADAAARTAAQARANVSGGVLKPKSGDLLASIDYRLFKTGSGAYAKIGTDYYVGRFWEAGFNGSMDVRGHLRAIKHGSKFDLMKLSRKGKVRRVKSYATGAAQVRPYHRNMDGSPRPWLKTALDTVREDFRRRCQGIAERPQ